MNRALLFLTVISLAAPVALFAGGQGAEQGHEKSRPAAKPSAPLKISISPAQAGLLPADIRPGDVVEFRISATSHLDVPEMRIKIELTGGLELVSGETDWQGPIAQTGEKALTVTVRMPLKGSGEIKARALIHSTGGPSFSAGASYRPGGATGNKATPMPPLKKDGAGRDIIEYRLE